MKTLPENILRAMNPADRMPLGKIGRTFPELEEAAEAESERALQSSIRQYCQMRDWIVFGSRFGKRTARLSGEPDLSIKMPFGITMEVECKTATGKLSKDQEILKAKMQLLGHTVYVVKSLPEFKSLAENLLVLKR